MIPRKTSGCRHFEILSSVLHTLAFASRFLWRHKAVFVLSETGLAWDTMKLHWEQAPTSCPRSLLQLQSPGLWPRSPTPQATPTVPCASKQSQTLCGCGISEL